MRYNPEKYHRRSIRLKDYDYSQAGFYFITICTHNKECLFGGIVNGEMRLNGYGEIVLSSWNDLQNHYANIELDAFVVMPNHVHGIIINVANDVGAGFKPAPTTVAKNHTLFEIVRGFKTFSSRRINETRGTPGSHVWQRNYYEHIIRNEDDLDEIREYIINNPLKWDSDTENPGYKK